MMDFDYLRHAVSTLLKFKIGKPAKDKLSAVLPLLGM
jgi:hypothetical protein